MRNHVSAFLMAAAAVLVLSTLAPPNASAIPECFENADCTNNDGFACTFPECDEGVCIEVDSDAFCDDGATCTTDTCTPSSLDADSVTGCLVVPNDASCDDGATCTTDSCTPDNVDADSVTGCLAVPNDASCDDSATCTTDSCTPDNVDADSVTGCLIVASDAACDDGGTCTTDSCSPDNIAADFVTGCLNAADNAACDDGASCTIDSCSPESTDADSVTGCLIAPNDTDCPDTDGATCTEELCDPADEDADEQSGCVTRSITDFCDDGWLCTEDACAPGMLGADGTTGCLSQPNDQLCDNGAFCDGAETCEIDDLSADVDGCVDNDDPVCTPDDCHTGTCAPDENQCDIDEGAECNGGDGICKFDGQCSTCNPNDVDACDDGLYCIVDEFCSDLGECVAGNPLNVSDGVNCTVDTCTEGANAAVPVHTPNNAACNDSNPCTQDFCHVTADCIPGINLANGSPCAVGLEVGTCQSGTCSDLCEPNLADVPNISPDALAAIEAACPTCPADVVSGWTHWRYRMCVRAASTALYRSDQLTRVERKAVRKAARDSEYAR